METCDLGIPYLGVGLGLGIRGPKYKTLRNACDVLVAKNTMGEHNTF